MRRSLLLNSLVFVIPSITACATKVYTFKTSGPASVVALSPSKLDDPGQRLGDTPLTVSVETLQGKVVKVSQPGKLPVYWVVAEAAGDTTEANIRLLDDPSVVKDRATIDDKKVDSRATTNRMLRLLMKSYQALSGKRYKAARDLADQAGTIDPQLAAPEVIKGLSLYLEGNLGEAKTALLKAQALDPEDGEIGALLKAIR